MHLLLTNMPKLPAVRRSQLAAILCASYFFSDLFINAACSATGNNDEYSRLDSTSSSTDFLNASCQVTLYPDLCFKTLSPYVATIQTSPTALADVALNVSFKSAKSASDTVSDLSKGSGLSPRETQAMRDCLENMGDSVDELQKSLAAMEGLDLEGPDFQEKMGDVMTWVSAALTDEDTCMDGFEEHGGSSTITGARLDVKVKTKIRSNIVKLAELTSNALALINRLTSSHPRNIISERTNIRTGH